MKLSLMAVAMVLNGIKFGLWQHHAAWCSCWWWQMIADWSRVCVVQCQLLTKEYYTLQTSMEKRVSELEAVVTDKSGKLETYEKLEHELDEVVMQAADGNLLQVDIRFTARTRHWSYADFSLQQLVFLLHEQLLPCDAMHSTDCGVARCLSACLSICLSHAGIVSKQLDISTFFCHWVATPF